MDILFPTGKTPIGREKLFLAELSKEQDSVFPSGGVAYYDFPTSRDYENDVSSPSFLILSIDYGVLIFQCTDDDLSVAIENVDQVYTFLDASFRKSSFLRKTKRSLTFPLETILFQYTADSEEIDSLIIQKLADLPLSLEQSEPIDQDTFDEVRSIIEGAKAIGTAYKGKQSHITAGAKGTLVAQINGTIRNFDVEQRKVSLNLVNGPQRVRGLAGSGKTIVLAMKAAQIHLANPDKLILFTFHTKSLLGFVKSLIAAFYRHFAEQDPNWDYIDVIHSWGGQRVEGVCSNAAGDNSTTCPTFSEARHNSPSDPFDFVCEKICSHGVKQKYEYILVDEAQDLPNHFFQLCFQLANGKCGHEKKIIWAYDELQSIFKIYQRTPQELFGLDDEGNPNIDLEKFAEDLLPGQTNDLVLHKCYRNPLPILVSAHALGFGIYAEIPVQMLENSEHWEDVGYKVTKNPDFTAGVKTVITRPQSNSPLLGDADIDELELIQNYIGDDSKLGFCDEIDWICRNIQEAISDGLQPSDIMVISVDDINAKTVLARVSAGLSEYNIGVHNVHSSTAPAPVFRVEDRVTLSTVHKAKGNEAMMVFVSGVEALYNARRYRGTRNKIFTAFTRTKAWLRVSGLGAKAQFFIDELDKALQHSPDLEFTFPDLSTIETIQRDLSKKSSRFNEMREKIFDLKAAGLSDEDIKAELGLL